MTAGRRTQDVTIWDESNDYSTIIDSSGDLHNKSKIWDGTNAVTVTNNKLDVNANITNSLVKYKPRFDVNGTTTAISDTVDTTILTITDAGKIDFLSVNFSTNKALFIITVDGVEIFRQNLFDLGSTAMFRLGGSGNSPNDIFIDNTQAQIFIKWADPVDFDTSVVIAARRTTITGMNMDGAIIKWRKKV